MKADRTLQARVMAMEAGEAIEDRRLALNSLFVIVAMIVAFVFAGPLRLEAGTIALTSGAVLMLLDTLPHHRDAHADAVTAALNEVEWITIFFFVGLFVLVGAIEKAGILDLLASELLRATGGDAKTAALAILWGSAVLSAFVDNIPFVAAMIPLIKSMAPAVGGDSAVLPLWWSLALGACLGGNGTLVGAAANLTVAGLAERNGVAFRFMTFTLLAFPLMLVEIAICHVYVLWRFF
jgi:Na+/H+ antiporter NhaD/arsenite permease-like protein